MSTNLIKNRFVDHRLQIVILLMTVLWLAAGCGAHIQKKRVRYSPAAPGYKVVQTAKKHIGTPYRYGGKKPGGFDCSGFTYYVYKKNGFKLPRRARDQARSGHAVRRSQLKPGDLVFFRTGGKNGWHVGIYTGKGQFIHAPSSGKRVRIQSLNHKYYKRRYFTARRIVG